MVSLAPDCSEQLAAAVRSACQDVWAPQWAVDQELNDCRGVENLLGTSWKKLHDLYYLSTCIHIYIYLYTYSYIMMGI